VCVSTGALAGMVAVTVKLGPVAVASVWPPPKLIRTWSAVNAVPLMVTGVPGGPADGVTVMPAPGLQAQVNAALKTPSPTRSRLAVKMRRVLRLTALPLTDGR
jgi:hypothetical protein